MTFGEFLQRMQSNEQLYLTTQYEEDDGDENGTDTDGAADNPLQVCRAAGASTFQRYANFLICLLSRN
jgi:hypothetical protein